MRRFKAGDMIVNFEIDIENPKPNHLMRFISDNNNKLITVRCSCDNYSVDHFNPLEQMAYLWKDGVGDWDK